MKRLDPICGFKQQALIDLNEFRSDLPNLKIEDLFILECFHKQAHIQKIDPVRIQQDEKIYLYYTVNYKYFAKEVPIVRYTPGKVKKSFHKMAAYGILNRVCLDATSVHIYEYYAWNPLMQFLLLHDSKGVFK